MPHLDGPRPRVVEARPRGPLGGGSLGAGGRLGAASLLLLGADGGALATPAATRTATAAAAIAATLAAAVVVASAAGVGAPGAGTGIDAPGAGLRRGCRSPGRGGEGGGRRRLAVRQSEFLQDEIVAGLQEGEEGSTLPQEGPDMGEVVVEAADHVEDKSVVGDDFAEGPKIVGHLLEAATVLGDGEVALDEVAKPHLQLDGASLPVPEELRLDGEPGISGGRALRGDGFSEVVGESAEDPGLHHTVHPGPIRREDWCVEVDVILERELAKS